MCLFNDDPTSTHLLEHDIDVDDAQPVRQRFYRISQEKRKVMEKEIKYMLDNRIAEPSASSFCFYYPIWTVFLFRDEFWIEECTGNFPAPYEHGSVGAGGVCCVS